MRGAKIVATDVFLSRDEEERCKRVRDIIVRRLVKAYVEEGELYKIRSGKLVKGVVK